MFHEMIITIPAWVVATGGFTLILVGLALMVFGALSLWLLFQWEEK